MATDINKVIANLLDFYNFTNQRIISVGAGGGQLIEYARSSKQVIAIDNNKQALDILEQRLQKSQLLDKFTLLHSDFYHVQEKGDVLMFEFCLHEMNDPEAAIHHAMSMTSDILIMDHWPASEWAYIADEKEKAEESWKDIQKFEVKKIRSYDTFQFFHDYEELFQKIKGQGEKSIQRIEPYKDKKDFSIPMSYGFALI